MGKEKYLRKLRYNNLNKELRPENFHKLKKNNKYYKHTSQGGMLPNAFLTHLTNILGIIKYRTKLGESLRVAKDALEFLDLDSMSDSHLEGICAAFDREIELGRYVLLSIPLKQGINAGGLETACGEKYFELAREGVSLIREALYARDRFGYRAGEQRETREGIVESIRTAGETLRLLYEFPSIKPEEISLHLRLQNAIKEENYELADYLSGKIDATRKTL